VPPAFRYRSFRSFWLGMVASVSGLQLLRFGQFWLMFQLTSSPLDIGYVALANTIPAFSMTLLGGVFADILDRRRLVIVTQISIAVLIFLLATLTLLDNIEVWHILTIGFFVSAVEAFGPPARYALYPNPIERPAIMSATVLNSAIWTVTRLFLPALAGLLSALTGVAMVFYLAGLGSLIMAAFMARLRVLSIPRGSAEGSRGQQRSGWIGVIAYRMILSLFSSVLGMAYITLMPVFAVDILEVGAAGQGLLLGIGGAGGLLCTIPLAYWNTVRYQGLPVVIGTILFGLLVATFALTSVHFGSFSLALVLMFVIGIFSLMHTAGIQSYIHLI